MSLKRVFASILILAAGSIMSCKTSQDSNPVPDTPALPLLEVGSYDLPTSDGSTVVATCVDVDSDGVMDGFDLDGDPSTLEILLGEGASAGVYGIDIDRDGEPDGYVILDQNGNITISTTQGSGGHSVVLVMDGGTLAGIDTNGDGVSEIALGELDLTVTVTTPGEASVTVSGDGTVLGQFDQMTVTGGLSGASSWMWYLDGEIVAGETSNSYTVDCFSLSLGLGVHNITVIAVTSAVSYSNQMTFTVEN
jgi:hypothetical protein